MKSLRRQTIKIKIDSFEGLAYILAELEGLAEPKSAAISQDEAEYKNKNEAQE